MQKYARKVWVLFGRVAALILGVWGPVPGGAPCRGNLTLVWSDEFGYTGAPDPAKWGYDVGGGGWGNDELQYYTSRLENARVEGGRLIIEARKENYGGRAYTSARLVTRHKGDWRYGRFEIRAKLPRGRGTWPAIWMLPTDWVYGGWPNSGEIDIMEHVGHDMQRIHGTIHTKDFNHMLGTQIGSSIVAGGVDTAFHDYAMEWRPHRIDVFMDGVRYFSVTDNGTGFGAWPFDQRFHLLLNIAIGGTWGGLEGVDDSIFPQRLEVEHVRVYAIEDFAWAEPVPVPARLEAEDFSDQYGVLLEPTADAGGGVNAGWLTHNDWLEYRLRTPTAGRYAIDLRYASPSGIARVRLTAGQASALSGHLPRTGGWQSWATATAGEIDLPYGEVTLRLTIDSPVREDLNLNWLEVRLVKADPWSDPDGDGFNNLFETAFGLDPFTPDPPTRWPALQLVADGGQPYVQLSYRRLRGGTGTAGVDYTAGGIRYTVQVSATLAPGSWASGPAVVAMAGTPVDNGDGTETVTIRALEPLTAGSRFMRLAVAEAE